MKKALYPAAFALIALAALPACTTVENDEPARTSSTMTESTSVRHPVGVSSTETTISHNR
ncbi:MAG: hypothetical protein M3463_07020 [Verrucomicrobiota bacterium]|nr:hypothetical protein [Verrucomicrobiota bacterium]